MAGPPCGRSGRDRRSDRGVPGGAHGRLRILALPAQRPDFRHYRPVANVARGHCRRRLGLWRTVGGVRTRRYPGRRRWTQGNPVYRYSGAVERHRDCCAGDIQLAGRSALRLRMRRIHRQSGNRPHTLLLADGGGHAGAVRGGLRRSRARARTGPADGRPNPAPSGTRTKLSS